MTIESTDVVVVGAGLAGLVAAREITARGLSVLVLEARDRVGGRVQSVMLDGEEIEVGGRWIGPGQDQLKALATELGVTWAEHRPPGESVTVHGQHRIRGHRGLFSEDDDVKPEEIVDAVRRIDAMAESVPTDNPWLATNAMEWDGQTFGSWMKDELSQPVAHMIGEIAMGFLPHPRDVSLLHALFYLRSNGGFASILGLRGPPHDNEMLVGGADQLPIRIAQQLGDRLRLDSPVRHIRQDASGVEVECGAIRVRGTHCIIAIPPVLAGRLEYTPPMPAMRDYLTQRMPIRGKISAVSLYDTPFWLDQGLNGWGRTEKVITWGTRTATGRGALAILVGIEESMTLSSVADDERRQIILDELSRCFGPGALETKGFAEVYWAGEEYSRGCNSYCPTGVWTSYGPALREPVGRVHWAGTELAVGFVGQMEGAVRSGTRTAAEVLKCLD